MDGVQLRGASLLFPTESSGLLDTHLIDIGGMKDWDDLEATQRLGILRLNHQTGYQKVSEIELSVDMDEIAIPWHKLRTWLSKRLFEGEHFLSHFVFFFFLSFKCFSMR